MTALLVFTFITMTSFTITAQSNKSADIGLEIQAYPTGLIPGLLFEIGLSEKDGLLGKVGYIASAWASLACFSFMVIIGYLLGQKHYPISYPIRRILKLIFIYAVIIIGSILLKSSVGTMWASLGIGGLLFLGFVALIYFMERKMIIGYLKSS